MIINSGVVGGQDRPPLTKQVTITLADWNAVTKIATVSVDWAVAGMSAIVSPDEDSMQVFKDIAVQGVYLVQILNDYLVFKSGSGVVVDSSITMNIIASDDGQGQICNAAIVAVSADGMSIENADYTTTVTDNKAKINGINPYIKWEIPPYDEYGNEITSLASGLTNYAMVDELLYVNKITAVTVGASNNLKKVVFGKNVASIAIGTFWPSPALTDIVFERGRESLLTVQDGGDCGAFRGCTSLVNLVIPDKVFLSGAGGRGGPFLYCTGLKYVRYESTSVLGGVFGGCTALEELTFTQATPVSISSPTLIFNSAQYIFVPYDSLTAYSTATNWVSYAQYMYGIGTFTAGANLPTATTDGNWILVWYGTKANMKAGTNAIIVAPSEFDNEYGEIYCTKTAVA